MVNKDTPSQIQMKNQLAILEIFVKVKNTLAKLGLGSKSIKDLQPELEKMKAEANRLVDYPRKFNEYFAKEGWLAHDQMKMDTIEKAVDAHEAGDHEGATGILLDYYSPENITSRMMYFTATRSTNVRRPMIEQALKDCEAMRYMSAIPLLLIVIDGVFNDVTGKGFHSEASLELWDSPMTADGAFQTVHRIYTKGRRRINTEEITLPYRNGILHGMEMGYANKTVAAKCWCVLFAVRDWVLSKASEDERKAKFKEESKVPTLRELFAKTAARQDMKRACEQWRPRELPTDYESLLVSEEDTPEDSPERVAIRCMRYWQKHNYGSMADSCRRCLAENPKKYAGELRQQYDYLNVTNFRVTLIEDEAPSVANIHFKVSFEDPPTAGSHWKVRLIREDDEGTTIPAGIDGGTWRVVFMREEKD